MQETTKTIGFVAVAAGLVVAAVGSHFMNKPRASSDFELVGQPFYESFESTEQAKALEVAAVDSETGELKQFSVAEKDGLWRIPSQNNYPAEAAARLAETATSVLGLERQTLVGRQKDDYTRFGVVDPLGDDVDEDPSAVGKRITIKDEDGENLVDFIIGKEVEVIVAPNATETFQDDQNPAKNYYVRRADEQQTYSVPLKLDLSTKFSDWINPDLLQLDRQSLVSININNYSIEERGSGPFGQVRELFKQQGDQISLNRTDATEPWYLDGLDDTAETVKTAGVNEVIGVLDNITLAGVRPRFKYNNQILLTPDLQLAKIPELEADPRTKSNAIGQLQRDLMSKGFNFGGTQDKLELVSDFGEIEVGTADGVLYRLNVGKTVEDEGDAIEIGDPDSEKKADDPEAVAGEEVVDPAAKEDDSPNRYVFVRVEFNDSLIGEEPVLPVEPTEPVKPEGYAPPVEEAEADSGVAAEPVAGDDGVASDESADKKVDSTEEGAASDDAAEKEEKPARDPKFDAYDLAMETYEQAKVDYELGLSKFEEDVKDRKEKTELGKKRVKELNERFGEWYYVVSAENLKTLQSTRMDLVEKKAPPAQAPGAPAGGIPARPNIAFPNLGGPPPTQATPPPETLVKPDSGSPEETKVEGEPAMEAEGEGSDAVESKPAGEEKVDGEKSDSPESKAADATETAEGSDAGELKKSAESAADNSATNETVPEKVEKPAGDTGASEEKSVEGSAGELGSDTDPDKAGGNSGTSGQ